MILAWTGDELSRGQTWWRTDGLTGGQTQATTIPGGKYWPSVKTIHWRQRDIMASQLSGNSIVFSTDCSGAHKIKHQSSASLVFVRGIHRWSVNSPDEGPVTGKMFPFYVIIMSQLQHTRTTGLMNIPCGSEAPVTCPDEHTTILSLLISLINQTNMNSPIWHWDYLALSSISFCALAIA